MDLFFKYAAFLILLLGSYFEPVFSQGYTYVGCYYDDHNRDILPDLIYCNRSRAPYETCINVCGPQGQNYCQSNTMTIALCHEICLDQNMRYFGLQAGSQCLCGGDFAPYDTIGQPSSDNTCVATCTGNSSQICGGEFLASIYEITEYTSDCFNPGYVLNGKQSEQTNVFYNAGDSIDYGSVCPPPSVKNGAASIECTAVGNWTTLPPTCIVRCPVPTPPAYATFKDGQSVNRSSYEVGDTVFFDCDNDANSSSNTLICSFVGDWDTGVTCPEPTTPPMPTTTQQSTAPMTTTPPPTTDTPTTTAMPTTQRVATAEPTTPAVSTLSTIMTTMTPMTTATTPSTAVSSSQQMTTTMVSGAASSEGTTMSSTEAPTDGSTWRSLTSRASTTVASERQEGSGIGMLPIIIAAAAGGFILIVIIVIVSYFCSQKRKRRTKDIPFNPDLGPSTFTNNAFDVGHEALEADRGFVQENDYGDLRRQTYDVDIEAPEPEGATSNSGSDRAPPDGKDAVGDIEVEGDRYRLDKNRRKSSVSSFKPDNNNGGGIDNIDRDHLWPSLPTQGLPQNFYNSELSAVSEVHYPEIYQNGKTEEDYFTDPTNQMATPL